MGDAVFKCTGGISGQQLLVDLTVALNTPLTNPTTASGLTDALLTINEPSAPVQPGVTVFRGQRVGNYSLEFKNIPVPVPGPNAFTTLRIMNLRGSPDHQSGPFSNPVYAFISSSRSELQIESPNQIALPATSHKAELRTAADTAFTRLMLNPANGLNTGLLDGTPASATPQFLLKFTELFPNAFRSRTNDPNGGAPPQNRLGVESSTETGYYDPALTATDGWNRVGLATNGTRLMARFFGIPAGASVYVSTSLWPVGTVASSDGKLAIGTTGAKLIATDGNGAGAYSPLSPNLSTQAGGQTVGLRALPVTNGSATAVWEITDVRDSAEILDALSFAVFVAYRPNTITVDKLFYVQPSLGPIDAQGSVAIPRFAPSDTELWVTNYPSGPAPPPPVLLTPANNETGVNFRNVLLTWTTVNNAQYELYFGASPSPPFVATGGDALNPGMLLAGTKYYWYVVATNGAGTAKSAVATFTTANGPSAPPQVDSGPTGIGLTDALAVAYSDPDGGADISTIHLLVGTSTSAAGSCLIEYNLHASNYRLINDAGDGWSPYIPYGQGSPSNAVCTLLGASATLAGTAVIASFHISFSPGFAGEKKVYAMATDVTRLSSPGGWKQVGRWTVPTVPLLPELLGIGPVNPTLTSGVSGTFRAAFRHPGGQSQHYLGMILFLPVPNVVQFNAQGTCLIEYNRLGGNFDGKGGLRLIDNAGTGWLGRTVGEPLAPSTPPLSNNACTVHVAGATATFTSNDMIITVPVTFAPAYVTRTMGTFIQSNSVTGQWTDFRQFGNWSVPGAPVRPGPQIISATPTSGYGGGLVMNVTASHSSGIDHLGEVHIRMNSSIVGGAPCHVIYSPAANVISMINDEGTALVGPVPLTQTLSTGRCSIGLATRVVNDKQVTLTLPLFLHWPLGSGTKNIYISAFDLHGAVTHWIQTGTWVMP